MPFCTNCGKEIKSTERFCSGCGSPCNITATDSQGQRKTKYEGEIHKCPQCGEVLDSFTTVCSACGYEIRGASSTSAVKEFASKLDSATTEYQKENIIRSFPIPNTKEDIFEFMILVSSNIDEHPNKGVFNAWIAKFEQCYQKAKLSFKQESDFVKIEAIYEKTNKTIKKLRRKGPVRKLLTVVLPIVILIILCVSALKSCGNWLKNPEPHGTDEEVARLEKIVLEVEKALENKEYDLAMMQAKSIDFFPNHEAISDHERQWDIKRDYLIKEIISAAAEDGITMEYPTDTADEADKKSSSSVYDYEKSKQEIQDNIDEYNKYMDDVEDMWDQYTNSEPTE